MPQVILISSRLKGQTTAGAVTHLLSPTHSPGRELQKSLRANYQSRLGDNSKPGKQQTAGADLHLFLCSLLPRKGNQEEKNPNLPVPDGWRSQARSGILRSLTLCVVVYQLSQSRNRWAHMQHSEHLKSGDRCSDIAEIVFPCGMPC